jgi:hypothetical protein
MAWLGISREDLIHIKTEPSGTQARAALEALRQRTKKAYKRAVRELHPDRTGGDPEKSDLFRAVSEVYQEISGVKLKETSVPRCSTSRRQSARVVLRASLGDALFEISV